MEGKTPTERYLAQLCRRSFLSLWSHPNPYIDKKQNDAGTGKELCDLLVVFGDDVVLFSDKASTYRASGNLRTDWNRWYRRAVQKSIKQLYGAESWLRRFPDRIYLDPNCSIELPARIEIGPSTRVHRIAVAWGARDACIAHYEGGSGSLRFSNELDPVIITDDPLESRFKAFTVGCATTDYVHVLDDVSLELVLKEVDTITDFCRTHPVTAALRRRGGC